MNKEKVLKTVLAAVLCISFAQAQPFYHVGGGTNDIILSLYADTSNNILYAGGYFSIAGNIESKCIAKWDGISWDSTRNQIPSPGFDQIRGIEKFGNEIYITGIFGFNNISGNLVGLYAAKWDSTNSEWINFGSNANSTVFKSYAYNGNLYLMGGFDTIGGIFSSKIARYDGVNWHAYPTLDISGGGPAITDAIFYNGELYVGGNFNSQISSYMKDIAKWDGTQWLPVGNGLNGFGWVNDFTIYQGKLIVAGWMSTASGDPGNAIAAWDGSQWSQLGAGATGQVLDVEVYNGELWASGCFTGNPCTYLAKWNGLQWDTLGIILDGEVDAMAVLGNDLYIAGGFATMNGDTVNRIIRYNYITGFEEVDAENNELGIYPNPTMGMLNVKNFNSSKLKNIFIYNTLGEKVKTFKAEKSIFIGDLPKGLYLVQVRSDAGIIVHTEKIILK